MTREEHVERILGIPNHNILLTLPTSFGKSKIGLEILKKRIKTPDQKILIVVPRNVLKQNWREEFIKWKLDKWLPCVTFTTYVSLPKYAGKWDFVIFDEAHHLSDRCREALTSFNITDSVLLSATVKYTLKDELREVFDNLIEYNVSTKEAINEEVLPDPHVFLYPLFLKTTGNTEVMVVNKNAKNVCPKDMTYDDYWRCRKSKQWKFNVYMTEKEYYALMCKEIDFYKSKSYNPRMKNIWLHLCGERLKWLAEKKNDRIKEILRHISTHRSLTFCNSIEQTEILGKYCINSKNKESVKILNDFNNHKVHHITACGMLNEGMNLTDCQVGIYANYNSSETIIKQRLGRLLRHKNPIIILPFIRHTREEELVAKMLEDYNPELIEKVHNVNEINI